MIKAHSILCQVRHTARLLHRNLTSLLKVEVRGYVYTHCAGATNEEKKMITRLCPTKTFELSSIYIMSRDNNVPLNSMHEN